MTIRLRIIGLSDGATGTGDLTAALLLAWTHKHDLPTAMNLAGATARPTDPRRISCDGNSGRRAASTSCGLSLLSVGSCTPIQFIRTLVRFTRTLIRFIRTLIRIISTLIRIIGTLTRIIRVPSAECSRACASCALSVVPGRILPNVWRLRGTHVQAVCKRTMLGGKMNSRCRPPAPPTS